MPSPEGLLVSGVTVRFGGVTAVDGAGLTAPPATVTGLIGPDGAGKTTLCDVIAGLRRPCAGTVRLDGEDLTGGGARDRVRHGIARTSQRPGPSGALTVHESVRAAAGRHVKARRHAGASWAERWRRRRDALRDTGRQADEILARVGIADYAERRASSVPPDVARLVALAQALAAEPAVLLLDEPWTGLPVRRARALEVLLRDLAAEGLAVLVAESELEPVMGVCDVLHVLDAGRMIATGPPVEVRADRRVRDAYRASPGPGADAALSA
ncbi:ATP-binding cassette domain-containing protein [Actinomadura rubrisoli]|uniref:ATP-binding cassette domain-containing protein n=1 Tax=Actinomadura rubrisoli TaxID=2530368 RepID=A0A4R5BFS7_9ACTN|nr:ATP-binding cassette domain-containing protein [Actinomadura rubrisoli]TDD85221.1 ATP-binding cassette domain-containing protein [Actinomadura rubrisoli]